jgi:hypothetical protein
MSPVQPAMGRRDDLTAQPRPVRLSWEWVTGADASERSCRKTGSMRRYANGCCFSTLRARGAHGSYLSGRNESAPIHDGPGKRNSAMLESRGILPLRSRDEARVIEHLPEQGPVIPDEMSLAVNDATTYCGCRRADNLTRYRWWVILRVLLPGDTLAYWQAVTGALRSRRRSATG